MGRRAPERIDPAPHGALQFPGALYYNLALADFRDRLLAGKGLVISVRRGSIPSFLSGVWLSNLPRDADPTVGYVNNNVATGTVVGLFPQPKVVPPRTLGFILTSAIVYRDPAISPDLSQSGKRPVREPFRLRARFPTVHSRLSNVWTYGSIILIATELRLSATAPPPMTPLGRGALTRLPRRACSLRRAHREQRLGRCCASLPLTAHARERSFGEDVLGMARGVACNNWLPGRDSSLYEQKQKGDKQQ